MLVAYTHPLNIAQGDKFWVTLYSVKGFTRPQWH